MARDSKGRFKKGETVVRTPEYLTPSQREQMVAANPRYFGKPELHPDNFKYSDNIT